MPAIVKFTRGAELQISDEVKLDIKHLLLPPTRQIGWIVEINRSRCNVFLGDGYVLHDVELNDLSLLQRFPDAVQPFILEAIFRIQKLKNRYYSIMRPQTVPSCIENRIKELEDQVTELSFQKFRNFVSTISDFEILLERSRGLETELKMLQEKYSNAGTTIDKLNEKMIDQKRELVAVRRDLQTISDDHTRMAKTNEELSVIQTKTLSGFEQSGEENEMLKQELKRINRLWNESKLNNSRLLDSNQTLRDNLATVTRENFEFQNEIQDLKVRVKINVNTATAKEAMAYQLEKDRNVLSAIVKTVGHQNESLWQQVESWEQKSFQDTFVFLKKLYGASECVVLTKE